MLGRSSLSAALVALSVPVVLGLGAGGAHADPGPVPGSTEQTERPALQNGAGRRPAQVSRSAQRRAQAKARLADGSPLAVTIDDLSPSTVPEQGPIRVRGTVTNDDTVTRTTINVYAFVSEAPMTTVAELEAAAATDPEEPVGDRITDEAHKDLIPELAPGESASFDFSVPRGLLGTTESGVYWFGVHALADNIDGTPRDALTDGRARTFLPLVTARTEGQVDAAVAIPLRRQLLFNDDGSLDDLATWTRTLAPGGRLRSLVDFGAASGSDPVTWVVDPALVDAVRRLAAGNPPRSLAANLQQGEDDGEPDSTESPDPSISPAEEPTEAPVSDDAQPTDDNESPLDLDELDPVVQAASQAAQSWLDQLGGAMSPEDQVLTLPYGDVDVAAAAEHDPALLQRAFERSSTGLAGYDVATAPAVASPSGFLSAAALTLVPEGTTVVVSDAMLQPGERELTEGAEAPTEPAPSAATVEGRRVVVASTGAADGGPGPDDRTGIAAMRQRMLAEAAVRLLDPTAPPLTVVTPHDWNPSDGGAAFFGGLNASWLRASTIADVAADAAAPSVAPEELRYPDWQAQTELDAPSFDSANALVRSGAALQSLLTLNNVIGATVTDQALGTASYSARTRPTASRASADGSRDWIEDRLGQVSVNAPQAVTLASSSGPFNATITNRLDQPVTVALEAGTDEELRISGPRQVDIAARGRATVRLTAGTDENGVHRVRLIVVDKRGVPLGGSTALTVRSAQVSNVIWLFMGVGAALLFGAIGVRLFRRIRDARRTPAPADPPTEGSTAPEPAEPAEPAGAGRR